MALASVGPMSQTNAHETKCHNSSGSLKAQFVCKYGLQHLIQPRYKSEIHQILRDPLLIPLNCKKQAMLRERLFKQKSLIYLQK